jgi:hypothetical protein
MMAGTAPPNHPEFAFGKRATKPGKIVQEDKETQA